MTKKVMRQRRQVIQLTKSEKIGLWTIRTLSYCLGLIGLLSCIEVDKIENNLQEPALFTVFGLLGLFISIVTWVTLKAKFRYLLAIKDRSFISGWIVIGVTIGTIALANFYNRTNPKDISCKVYQIQKMDFYHGTRGFHHIYVKIGQSEERLKVTHETWHKLDGQSTVKLCVANGGLGFEYIETIDVP